MPKSPRSDWLHGSCEPAENRSVGGNVDSERQDQRRRKGHPEIEWRVRIGSDSLIRAGIRKDAPYHRCADLVAAFRSKYTLSIVPPAVKIVIGMLAPLLFATTGIKPPYDLRRRVPVTHDPL